MKWIDINEELPEDGPDILIHTDEGHIHLASKNDNQFYYDSEFSEDIENITHWMPLPNPPEKFESRNKKAQEKFNKSLENLNGKN